MRAGILGFAHGHVNAVVGEWRAHPEYGVEPFCGWDRDENRLSAACETHGLRRCASAAEVLESEGVEAVLICSETAYHAQLAVMAAQAGKKIILYKPMALTLDEADMIVEAVQSNNTDFTLAWQMRVDPVNLQIKRLLDDGTLGRPFWFRRRHCLAVHNDEGFKNTWHVDPVLNRDIFADDSAHATDFVHWLFGVPETVSCEMSTMHRQEVKNDVGVALFKYADGLIVEVMFSAVCSAAEITCEGYFERGALQHYCGDGPGTRLPHSGFPALKWFCEGDGDWTVSDVPLPAGQWSRIKDQAKPLADFLNGKIPPICSAVEARDSLRMVLACYLANETGSRIRLDDERISQI